ncbi:MAG: GntR family transcriptional regulator [Planctomycetes bacterium]|nr:GntR family transcriptional regulator [Planctomycetota bacterium]
MLLRLDPLSPTPVFEQLARQVKTLVAKGLLRPGDKLPSVRDLARDTAVNPNTILRTLELLERDHVIIRRQGSGCFVAPRTTDLSTPARKSQLTTLAAHLVTEAFHLGFDATDIRSAVNSTLDEIDFPKRKRSTS